MKPLPAPALGWVAVAASLVFAGPAAADHPSPSLPGLSESQVRAFETSVVGESHAAEHARQRAHASKQAAEPQFGAALNRGALSGEDGSYRNSVFRAADVQAAAVEPGATTGAWNGLFDLPMYAIHGAMLPTGKVLLWGPPVGGFNSSTTYAVLWDPVTGGKERVDPPANIYCSGQAFLADGQLLVVGGELTRLNGVKGLNKILTFDPFSKTWTEQPSMAQGRWYPSQALLPDGRQMIVQGSIQEASTQVTPPVEQIINKTIQVFNPPATRGGQGTLTTLAGELGGAGMPPLGDLYPNMRVMPSGRTFVAGPAVNDSWYLNSPGTANGSALSWVDLDNPSRRRLYGNAVFEPPPPGSTVPSDRVIQLGGRVSASETNHQSTSTSEYIDESESGAGWQAGPSYQQARTYQNTVLLPDASMVSVGGGVGWPQFMGSEPLKQVELWDPATRTWRLGAAQQETRAYHSIAMLLPDGRVISAGDDGNAPTNTAWTDSAEIYEPPYLFKGPRPTIASAPAAVDWNQGFSVSTPNANIDRAVLIAPGATTHATDMHQRYVPLRITGRRPCTLDLASPSNANVAPPGYYMLFLVDSAGVPSVAKWVRIAPGAQPQAVSPCGSGTPDPDPDPDPGNGGGGGGGNGGTDTTPPGLKMTGKTTQKAGTSVGIVVAATTEDLIASATGTVSVPGGASKVYRLKAVRNRFVRRGTRATLRLVVPKKARKAIKRYLRRRPSKRLKTRIVLTVRDTAGNTNRVRRTVKLRR